MMKVLILGLLVCSASDLSISTQTNVLKDAFKLVLNDTQYVLVPEVLMDSLGILTQRNLAWIKPEQFMTA